MDTTRQKLYDMKAQRAKLVKAAGDLLAADDLEGHTAKTAEIEKMNASIDALEKQLQLETSYIGDPKDPADGQPAPAIQKQGKTDPKLEKHRKAFFAAVREGFPAVRGKGATMSEGVAADGGYTVPQDMETKIHHYRESQQCLVNDADVIPVKTESGSRVYRKRAVHTGFATQAEAAKMTGSSKPTYEVVEYKATKRSSYTPVTQELMEDTDENIEAEVVSWMGGEDVACGNKLMLTAIKSNGSAKDFKDLDGITAAWIGLGTCFRSDSKLYTNDNGLAWLAAQKDTTGRALLNPNPANPTTLQLCVGALTLPVEVYDNGAMPNDAGTKIPMIVGNLHEGIAFFERRGMTITSSAEATVGDINAFEQDMVIWKGSVRNDCKLKDKAAFVHGFINTAGV